VQDEFIDANVQVEGKKGMLNSLIDPGWPLDS
jgi:hypothetical protein